MNCRKCGAALVDDAKFCPRCGVRVDGKTECPRCGREIADDSVFCTYCGVRLDGKTVCAKCGEAFEGAFCPKCGTAARSAARPAPQSAPAAARVTAAAGGPADSSGRVLTVIRRSVLYGALCVLLVCSFFIGFVLTASSVSQSSGSTSFYFLITQFSEIKDALATLTESGATYYAEFEVSLYLTAAMMAACVAATMAVCIGYFIAGTVQFVSAMKGRRDVAMSRFVLVPAVLSLVFLVFMKSFFGVQGAPSGVKVEIGLGAGPIVNIVLVSVALAAAAVLYIVQNRRTVAGDVLRYALYAGGLALSFVLLVTLATPLLITGERGDQVGLSAPLWTTGFLAAIGMVEGDSYNVMYEILPDTIVVFVLYVLLAAAAAVVMVFFAKGIANGGKKSAYGGAACLFAALSLALSVAYLVMTAVLCGRPYLAEDAVRIGASPVCALVFSLLTLAMSVVCICLLRRKSPPPEEGTGPAVLSAEVPAAENSQENN